MQIRHMRAGERAAVLELLQLAFGRRELFEGYLEHDPLFRPRDFLLALDGDRPVSAVQLFEKRIRLRGQSVPMGGIGSVATHPEYRRRGLAARLMTLQAEAMRARGMLIGLLFSGLRSFYESLGWVQIPMPVLAIHAPPAPVTMPADLRLRSFEARDLPEIRRIYAGYCDAISGSTVRDAAYWDGQLRYAGNPDECFRLVERDGRIVAYARCVEISGVTHAMEYACRSGESDALAALLLQLCPPDAALFCRLAPDLALQGSLERAQAQLAVFEDPSPMWRVLDASALGRIANLQEAPGDRELLRTLLGEPSGIYWLSDRF
jgi:predicted N-acetyltransferase YhbS